MNAATGSDLKKECLRAEKRCTTHPYGSKAASRVLFDLSRNVQSKIVESRQIDDPNAVEFSKLREFRTEWETYFGNVFQGEMGVVPMTPAAAAETIRAQGASIKDLEKELTREREENKDVQAALQSALLTHQESAHRAARVESERINRQFEVCFTNNRLSTFDKPRVNSRVSIYAFHPASLLRCLGSDSEA